MYDLAPTIAQSNIIVLSVLVIAISNLLFVGVFAGLAWAIARALKPVVQTAGWLSTYKQAFHLIGDKVASPNPSDDLGNGDAMPYDRPGMGRFDPRITYPETSEDLSGVVPPRNLKHNEAMGSDELDRLAYERECADRHEAEYPNR